MGPKADKIYLNGNIYTVNPYFTKAEAMAVAGDRFIAVGSNEEVKKCSGADTQIIDLEGCTVLPGLIDSHVHVDFIGTGKLEIDGHDKTKEEILSMVAEEYKNCKKGQWIKGSGWNNTQWTDSEFPTKEELDKVSSDIPVNLKRVCGHASWVNSKALELAGIDKETADPVGGEFLRDADGNPTGMVTDQAQEYFLRVMPVLSDEEKERADMLAQEEFFKNGITSIHDAGSSEQVIDRWEKLYASGKLKVRKYVMFRVEGRPDYSQLMDTASAYFKRGLTIGRYDNRLTVRAFKLSADGSMGARSAWMIEDYTDRPGHRGNGKLNDQQMYDVIKLSLTHGFQMVVHAIGDACNKQALDAYERVFRELPLKDHRCRIEHAQVLRPEDVVRFSQLGIIPSVQPIAFATDMAVVGERWGAQRMKTAYAWRKLRDSGCTIIPISTDAPVDDINPFCNMYAAISRKNLEGEPTGGWYREEAMTRAEALRGATIMGAYSAFEEQLKGSIESGKLADFTIIDRDYMECPEEEIKNIKVIETVLGGETVYRK